MKINKIELMAPELTVDIEVSNSHTYQVSNGCVSHNTTSLVFGCASGIHAYHSKYYIRRMRLGKEEELYKYLNNNHPDLLVDDIMNPNLGVLEVPIEAPDGSILRDESPIDMLERVKKFSQEWIQPGFLKGENSHNVSATVSIKDDEWDIVGTWMWVNRDYYNGLSVLNYYGGSHPQLPFEETDKETYEKMKSKLVEVDLSRVKEERDNTDLKGEVACGAGGCEIK